MKTSSDYKPPRVDTTPVWIFIFVIALALCLTILTYKLLPLPPLPENASRGDIKRLAMLLFFILAVYVVLLYIIFHIAYDAIRNLRRRPLYTKNVSLDPGHPNDLRGYGRLRKFEYGKNDKKKVSSVYSLKIKVPERKKPLEFAISEPEIFEKIMRDRRATLHVSAGLFRIKVYELYY